MQTLKSIDTHCLDPSCSSLLQIHICLCAAQVLIPQLEALNADIMVLSADTDCERRKREAAGREVAELKDKLQQV